MKDKQSPIQAGESHKGWGRRLSSFVHTAGELRRWIYSRGIIALVCILAWIIYGVTQMAREDEPEEIVLQDTPIDIESVRPKGELYVCTALAEDYATRNATEMHLGMFPERHSCVQMLKQKVSFKIDLEKVQYTVDTLNVMIVQIPEPVYVASTQDSPFMSDDEDYWNETLKSTNGLKKEAEQKIRKRFDTDENRAKATRYAEAALRELLRQLGYEARFAPHLQTETRKQ